MAWVFRERVGAGHDLVTPAARTALRVDALLAAVLAAVSLLELADRRGDSQPGELAVGAVLVIACTAPVAWRRRARVAAFAVVVAAGLLANVAEVVGVAAGTSTSVSGVLVMLGTVVAHGGRRERAVAIGVVAGGLLTVVAVTAGSLYPSSVAYLVGILGAAVVLGDVLRRRGLTASAGERARIADELHDGLTGHLASVVVQSASARHAFDTAPEQARDALRSIEEAGRSALEELRGLVAPTGTDAPATGTDDLPAALGVLARRADRSGTPLTIVIEGPARPVPAAVAHAVLRLVHEAATNVLRHAPRAHVQVNVGYAPRAVSVEVRNGPAAGPADLPAGSGRGLVGVQERAVAVGASFRAGPTPDGGFSVGARFPLPEAA